MTSACSSNSLPRRVTKPRSPGPAPTRKHFPFLVILMLTLELLKNIHCQFLRVTPPPHCDSRGHSIAKNLRAQFQLSIHKPSVHAYRQIAITLQQSQELALGPQTQVRITIING